MGDRDPASHLARGALSPRYGSRVNREIAKSPREGAIRFALSDAFRLSEGSMRVVGGCTLAQRRGNLVNDTWPRTHRSPRIPLILLASGCFGGSNLEPLERPRAAPRSVRSYFAAAEVV